MRFICSSQIICYKLGDSNVTIVMNSVNSHKHANITYSSCLDKSLSNVNTQICEMKRSSFEWIILSRFLKCQDSFFVVLSLHERTFYDQDFMVSKERTCISGTPYLRTRILIGFTRSADIKNYEDDTQKSFNLMDRLIRMRLSDRFHQ